MYAVIEDSGTQFKVAKGDTLRIDRQDVEDDTIVFDRVLLVSGDGDADAKVGNPYIDGATVTATVQRAVKGKKIDIQKHKRRKGYVRKQGHRQRYTQVEIAEIKG